MYLTGPIESSTLLPKIQRNSMFPPMCSSEACMNIAVNTVSQAGIVPTALTWAIVPSGSVWPLQKIPTDSKPEAVC